jgi:hypothetical protein
MSAVAELISPQEYLELERQSTTKHEYIAGRVVEMAGDIDCELPLRDV